MASLASKYREPQSNGTMPYWTLVYKSNPIPSQIKCYRTKWYLDFKTVLSKLSLTRQTTYV